MVCSFSGGAHLLSSTLSDGPHCIADEIDTVVPPIRAGRSGSPRNDKAMVSRRRQDGFTLIELLLVVAIIAIIAAIAMPGLLRARMASSETSAIETMRAIGTAQQIYAEHCHGYAPVLTELRAAGNYLSPDMTGAVTVAKSGYSVTITAGAGNQVLATQMAGCTASGTNYFATAVPLSVGSTGTRAFAIDDRGAIWQDTTGVAPSQPFVSSGTVSVIQ